MTTELGMYLGMIIAVALLYSMNNTLGRIEKLLGERPSSQDR